jgi:hypothetical protein
MADDLLGHTPAVGERGVGRVEAGVGAGIHAGSDVWRRGL